MENRPQTKAELLEQMQQAWTELEQTLDQWTDEQMTGLRDQAGWSIQDHLDHLVPWAEGTVALLERRSRYEAMGIDAATAENSGFDELNAILRARTPRRSLAETRAAARAAHEHLLRTVEGIAEGDLFKPYSYYDPTARGENSGNPVVGWIVGNSSGHYREHLPWIQAIAVQGSPDQANS